MQTEREVKHSKPEVGRIAVFPHQKILYCPSTIAEKHFLKFEDDSGWWILCADCKRWFSGGIYEYIPAHTIDGYKTFGGCAVGSGNAIIGQEQGLLADIAYNVFDAVFLYWGKMSVPYIAEAIQKNWITRGEGYRKSMRKAIAYIKRVNLQTEEASLVMQVAEMMGLTAETEKKESHQKMLS